MKFRVWDELNQEEDEAREIDEATPYRAAIEYAKSDDEGICDGLYLDGPQPICVKDDEGKVHRFDVSAEPETGFIWSAKTAEAS